MAETAQSILNLIVNDSNLALREVTEGAQKVMQNAAAGERTALSTKEKLQEAGKANELVTATKLAADLQTQQATIKVARAAGVDPTAAADFFVNTATKMKEANDRAQQAIQFTRGTEAPGLFDWLTSPIQSFKLDNARDKARRDLYQDINHLGILSEQAARVTSTIQNAKTSYSTQQESMTAASVQAATKLAQLESEVQANIASQEALKFNTAQVTAAMNASQDVVKLQHSKQAAVLAQANYEQSLKKFDRDERFHDEDRTDRNEARKAREEARQDKLDDKLVDEQTLAKLNLGFQAHGKKPITAEEFKSRKMMFRSGQDRELALMYRAGELTFNSEDGTPMLGSSPTESMAAIEAAGSQIADQRKLLISNLYAIREDLQKSKEFQGLDDAGKIRYLNKEMVSKVAASGSEITGKNHHRHIGDLANYQEIQGIASTQVYSTLLAPLAKSGKSLEDPEEVLQLVISAVNKNLLSTSTAVRELNQIYGTANQIHQKATNYKGLGLELGENGTKYNIRFKTGAFSSDVVDMTDPKSLTSIMNKFEFLRRTAGYTGF